MKRMRPFTVQIGYGAQEVQLKQEINDAQRTMLESLVKVERARRVNAFRGLRTRTPEGNRDRTLASPSFPASLPHFSNSTSATPLQQLQLPHRSDWPALPEASSHDSAGDGGASIGFLKH